MKYIPSNTLEQKATALLKSLDAFGAPVPVDVVAHRMGLRVEEVPFGDEVSGVLVVSEGGGVIGVNSGDALVRRRFTMAHELAHFVLHKNESRLFIDKTYVAFRDSRSGSGDNRAEIQANQFAAALLMPRELITEAMAGEKIDLGEEELLDTLASTFSVSSQAMAYRIADLGFLLSK